jgi:hypothetical protein
MKTELWTLTLARDGTVNLLHGTTHIYLPDARKGQVVCRGRRALVEAVRQSYALAGYETQAAPTQEEFFLPPRQAPDAWGRWCGDGPRD